MNIGFSTGYREEFWRGWPWSPSYGGSEHMVVELAKAMSELGHNVTVRLPRPMAFQNWKGVRWIGDNEPPQVYDVIYSFDDYGLVDGAAVKILVACRSDPPVHTVWDELVFLSKTHAAHVGMPDRPAIGGGVKLWQYPYVPRDDRKGKRVIYTSSPDRGGQHASVIGDSFRFTATYHGACEMSREDLIALQRQAMVQIHPCDPRRPSEFFCMSVLEAMAAGTPCIISDADALPELWAASAIILPRPIRYNDWIETVEWLMNDKVTWERFSTLGIQTAKRYDWPLQAQRYLEIAGVNSGDTATTEG